MKFTKESKDVCTAIFVCKDSQVIIAETEGIYLRNLVGSHIHIWEYYCNSTVVGTYDAKYFCVHSLGLNWVDVIELDTKQVHFRIDENAHVESIQINASGEYLLVNFGEGLNAIFLYHISQKLCLQSFSGHEQYSHHQECFFGGANEEYILCGTSQNQIHVWNRSSTDVIQTLTDLESPLKTIGWMKETPSWFLSLSDDRNVSIWGIDNTYDVIM